MDGSHSKGGKGKRWWHLGFGVFGSQPQLFYYYIPLGRTDFIVKLFYPDFILQPFYISEIPISLFSQSNRRVLIPVLHLIT